MELITDVTASDGPNRETADFTRATGGCWTRWQAVSYTHLRAHETVLDLVCRLLLEKKKEPRILLFFELTRSKHTSTIP